MARRPEDPRVADLKRYRKARELEQRRKAAPPRNAERLLGSRRGAGLILAVVVIVLVLMWLLPMLR